MGWLRRRFLFATAALLLLTLASAAYVVREINDLARARAEQQLLETTRALSSVVEGQLRQFETMLHALVGAEALVRDDFDAFDTRARALLAGPEAWIVLGDREGRQLVNTRLPHGARLPIGRPPAKAFRALDKNQTHFCDLTEGLVTPQILCVDVPVRRGGKTVYHLSVIFKPSLLQRIIRGQRLGPATYATILDSNHVVVWRNVNPERFVGLAATGDLRHALATSQEGVGNSVSLEGVPTVAAYSRSPSGYSFIVGRQRSALTADAGSALRSGLVIAALLLLTGLAIAFFAGRKLANAITSLYEVAGHFAAARPTSFRPTGIPEVDQVGHALEGAAAERDRNEERLRDITNALPVLISYIDADYRFRFVNQPYEAWFERPREEILGRTFREVMGDEMYEVRRPWIERAMAGETISYEAQFITATVQKHTLIQYHPHRGSGGELLGIYTLVQDITPQKLAEQAVRSSRDRLAAVLDATPAAILIATDPSCRTIEGNARAAELMRMQHGENISRSDPSSPTGHFRVFDENGQERAEADLPVQRAARGEELWMIEDHVVFEDGTSIHLLGNAVPLKDASGTIEGAVGAFIDITERKRAEEHQQLLISELNHRVKNTLAIVQSLAQQSFKGSTPVEVSRKAFEARLSALAAAHSLLTRQNWESADLAEVVRTSVLAAAGDKAARVTIDGPDLPLSPQTSVSMAMAIHELCTNAIKYGALSGDAGRVTVEWRIATSDKGDRLQLEWRERDGPPVASPSVRGFGTRMIERGLAGELGGEARLHFESDGLRCALDTPLPRVKS